MYCKLLEKGFSIQVDGTYSPCCQFEWQHESPTDFETFKKLRSDKHQEMMSTDWIPECRWCKQDHTFKGESMRDHVNATVEGNFWELWFSNTCNLSCRMCNSALSSTWQQIIKRNPHLEWDKNFKMSTQVTHYKFQETEFFNDLPNTKHLKLLGGEPMLIKEVKRVLQYVLDNNFADQINLHLTTNLTQTVDDWWIDVFKSFKTVRVIGSVDGLGKRYEYIRPGSNFDIVLKNAQVLKDLSQKIKHLSFIISCTGQTLTAFQHKDIYKFWQEHGLEVDIEQLYYPEFMSYRSLNPTLRKLYGIESELTYDPSQFEQLVKHMKIQDQIHGTSFHNEFAELFD